MTIDKMSITELLTIKQKEMEVFNKLQKRNGRLFKATIIFLAVNVIFLVSSIGFGNSALESKYNKYMEAYNSSLDEFSCFSNDAELLQYKDAALYFEDALLGNTNANLMSFGKYYTDLERIIYSNDKGLILNEKEKTKVIDDSESSYINVIGDLLYYRSDADYNIYEYNLTKNIKKKLLNHRVGQIIANQNGLFFIDFENNYNLQYMKFNCEIANLIADDVSAFAMVGDDIIYLDFDHNLYRFNIPQASNYRIQSNIERFTFSKQIIAENNGSIISFNTKGHHPKLLINNGVHLIAANSEYIVYCNADNLLCSYNRETGENNCIFEKADIYKAVYLSEAGYIIMGLNIGNDWSISSVYETVLNSEVSDIK